MISKFTFISLILFSMVSRAAPSIIEVNLPTVTGEMLVDNIGIETVGGVLTPILKAGCRLPCEATQVFSTAGDKQNQIKITLVSGTQQMANKGVELGKYQILGIAPAPRGIPHIEVTFGASAGKIWMSVKEEQSNPNLRIVKVE